MGTTSRRWGRRLVAAAGLVVCVQLLAPVPAPANPGPSGAGLLEMTWTYDGAGVPPGECVETTFTIEGEVTGVLVFGLEAHKGTYTITGSGGTWPDACEDAFIALYLFQVTLSGTSHTGAEIDCLLGGFGWRWGDEGVGFRGDCTIDGNPVGEKDWGSRGKFVTDPPDGMITSTATAQTFRGPIEG